MDHFDLRKAYITIEHICDMTNKLLQDQAPWSKKLSLIDKSKAVYLIIESIRNIAILL